MSSSTISLRGGYEGQAVEVAKLNRRIRESLSRGEGGAKEAAVLVAVIFVGAVLPWTKPR